MYNELRLAYVCTDFRNMAVRMNDHEIFSSTRT